MLTLALQACPAPEVAPAAGASLAALAFVVTVLSAVLAVRAGCRWWRGRS